MSAVEILFEIPEWIRKGLDSKELIRHGGVIRDKSGKIRAFLTELGDSDAAQSWPGSLDSLGAQLAGVQQMQVLNMAGLGAVAIICVAGFLWLGHKIDRLQAEMDSVVQGVAGLRAQAERIERNQIISLANSYYRAVAAYQEKCPEEAWRHARDCSAEIQNYFDHTPDTELFVNEGGLFFLMQVLVRCLHMELVCAAARGDQKRIIHLSRRYEGLFQNMCDALAKCRERCRTTLPTTMRLPLIKAFGNPASAVCKLGHALPAALEMLRNETYILSLCAAIPREKMEAALNEGKRYLFMAEPA